MSPSRRAPDGGPASASSTSTAARRASWPSTGRSWPSATRSRTSTSRAACPDPIAVIARRAAGRPRVRRGSPPGTPSCPITLAWLLRKPSVMIIGGFDTANMPDIGYGYQQGGLRRWASRWIMRRATPPDHELRLQPLGDRAQHADPAGAGDGRPPRRARSVRRAAGRAQGAAGAHRGRTWCAPRSSRRATGRSWPPRPQLPDVRFVFVGRWHDDAIEELRALAGANVEFTGWLSDEELQRPLPQGLRLRPGLAARGLRPGRGRGDARRLRARGDERDRDAGGGGRRRRADRVAGRRRRGRGHPAARSSSGRTRPAARASVFSRSFRCPRAGGAGSLAK